MKKEMRLYFYKDESGKTQKYIYCLRCNLTPYKQDQIGKDIEKISDFSYLCKNCCNVLAILKTFSQTKTEEDIVWDLNSKKKILKIAENLDSKDVSLDIENSKLPDIDLLENDSDSNSEKKENALILEDVFAYVLKCNDGTFYVGVTTDVEKVVKSHNWGSGSQYTRERRPVALVISEKASSMEEAKKMKIKLQKEYKIT